MRQQLQEIVKLKLQNFNLSLQILQLQANEIIAARDRILLAEYKRLKYNPKEWRIDEQTWELVKVEVSTE